MDLQCCSTKIILGLFRSGYWIVTEIFFAISQFCCVVSLIIFINFIFIEEPVLEVSRCGG